MKKILMIAALFLAALLAVSCTVNTDVSSPRESEPESGTISEASESSLESERDESEADGRIFEYEGLSVVLPEGFTVTTSLGTVLAVSPDYPKHTDNITFSSSEGDISDYGNDSILESYESVFETVENFTAERDTVDGIERITVKCRLSVNGVTMDSASYYYFIGKKCVSVTYTFVNDDMRQSLEASAKTIEISK